MSNRTHLVVGTPCYGGQVSSLYATSLMRLQAACAKSGDLDLTVRLLSGDALIPRARQDIAAYFLEDPAATHLLFVDADISFDPDQVFRLLKFDVEFCAGVYPTKRIDWDKAAQMAKEGKGNLSAAALSYVLELQDQGKVAVRDGFAKARYAGTGFLLLKRRVLEGMIARYPDLAYRSVHQAQDPLKDSKWRSALFNCLIDREKGFYLSEDYSFCRRWTDMGGEIWVDLQSRLTHVGTLNFNGDVSTQFAQA